jgi:RNA-directed DNA polymerase
MEGKGMSSRKERKAPPRQATDEASEAWARLPWRKLERHVYRLQKRIFRASQRGKTRAVHKLQKLLMKSGAARLLAGRKVTQDNQGKKTAGVDGVKSIAPKRRLVMARHIHPKRWKHAKPPPVRRLYIPKPGKEEKRPLGIPTLFERARQCLAKSALEPEWEARFEPNSYGFRPGRSCHDAIEGIFNSIKSKPKFVLDADIKGAFDHINQEKLLLKLASYPALTRLVRAWLKAGALSEEGYHPTEAGTPQGGVASPLLMNIALHGMETAIKQAFKSTEQPQVIRYADDFVVLHPTLEGIQRARKVIETWLSDIGLELKPSKTKVSHTLIPYQSNVGFTFLGFAIRQFPVGKTHTGKNPAGKPLGFKTLIRPSKEAVKRHLEETGQIVRRLRAAPQEQVVKVLNPVVRGWANYYRTVVIAHDFGRCDHLLYSQLLRWGKCRHPSKSTGWVIHKYWRLDEGKGFRFGPKNGATLHRHTDTTVRRYAKVRGTASPYDGNLLYWSTRLKEHPLFRGTLGKLLQKQQGTCRWCGLLFKDGDLIEIDHILPTSLGGGEELSNKLALHRHCHDQRHSHRVQGTSDKGPLSEEPCDGKLSRTVLKPSGGGDPFA